MKRLLILMILLSASGCVKQSHPTQFYLLQPLANQGMTSLQALESNGAKSKLSLGVGPVKIPAYLDRAQIVTGLTSNQIKLAEFDRWAEPLQDNFSRTLTENLSALLGSEQIIKYPWPKPWNPSYQIEMEVEKFHADAKGASELQAQWSIRQGQKVLLLKNSNIKTQAKSLDYEAIVAAESQAVQQISEEIAEAVKNLNLDQ